MKRTGVVRVAAMAVLGFSSIFGAGSAQAQARADSMRAVLRLPAPATFAVGARGEWVAPGITIGVPSGFGADFGDAFAALGFQASTRYGSHDGGAVVGFGVGDAQRLVGLEVAFSSFGSIRSCCRGGVSPKLHRVLGGNTSVAVGYENVLTYGHMRGEEEATDAGRSIYGSVTSILPVREDPTGFLGSVALTVGVGNGRFRRESDILAGRERWNPFASGGVRLADQASVITSWTGQDLAAGFSIVPIRGYPLFVTPSVADLTTEPRFIIGVGYGLDYASIF